MNGNRFVGVSEPLARHAVASELESPRTTTTAARCPLGLRRLEGARSSRGPFPPLDAPREEAPEQRWAGRPDCCSSAHATRNDLAAAAGRRCLRRAGYLGLRRAVPSRRRGSPLTSTGATSALGGPAREPAAAAATSGDTRSFLRPARLACTASRAMLARVRCASLCACCYSNESFVVYRGEWTVAYPNVSNSFVLPLAARAWRGSAVVSGRITKLTPSGLVRDVGEKLLMSP